MKILRTLLAHRWIIVAVGLVFFFFRTPRLFGWDESFYVAQFASIVSDRDLLLHDELLGFPNEFPEIFRSLTIILHGGAIQNTFSIGPALLWLPLAIAFPAEAFDPPGELFQSAIAPLSMLMVVILLIALFGLLRRSDASIDLAGVTVLCVFFSSPLALYGTRFYLNSHLLSALFATLLALSLSSCVNRPGIISGVTFGLIGGCLVIVRWQEAVIPVVVMSALIFRMQRSGTIPRGSDAIGFFGGIAGSGLLVAAVQCAAWKIQFDSWLLIPQGSGYMLWTRPAIIPFLLSGFHGFLPWAPGLFLGFAGLYLPFSRTDSPFHRLLISSGRILVPISIYISAASFDWWGGASFGPRRMCSMIPFAAIGFLRLLRRMKVACRWISIPILLLWAILLMGAYTKNLDDLTMLLFGKPDPSTIQLPDLYEQSHWRNRWMVWEEGIQKILKPGFTLTHKPVARDRVIGFTVVCLVWASCGVFKWMNRRFTWIKHMMLSTALASIAAILIWLLVFCPRNLVWNQAWLGILHGAPIEHAPKPFPPGVADAAHLIQGIRSFYLSDWEACTRSIGRISDPTSRRLDLDAVVRFVQSTENYEEIGSSLFVRDDERELVQKNLLTSSPESLKMIDDGNGIDPAK